MPKLQARPLADHIARIIGATGSPADEAMMVAEHLVGSNLRGHDSHGVIRTAGYVDAFHRGVIRPGARAEVVQESPAIAVLDGGGNYGQVVAFHAMELAIEKARATGFGFVACRNSGHIGRVGAYGEQAVAAGVAGWGGVNTPGSAIVAAFGGSQRRLGTSPIMFAMPTGDPTAPFILDMATSVVAEGKVRVRANRHEPVPGDWIIDGHGTPSTNPHDLYGNGDIETPGALLPLGGPHGGYKGTGLSLVAEALAGILSGAGTVVAGERGTNGVYLAAIDIQQFLPIDAFTERFDELVGHVKSSTLAPGVNEIIVAGEPERRVMDVRLRDGIEVDDETWRQIANAAASVGVSTSALPA